MAAAASGVSGVIVHGLADDEYGAVFDSAEKASKWKRCRLISSGEPNVAEIVASEPSCISSDAAAQSSTSIGFTRVVVRQYTRRGDPTMYVSMSSACTA